MRNTLCNTIVRGAERVGERQNEASSSSAQEALSVIFVALEFFCTDRPGTTRDTDYSGLGAPITTPKP